jgi:hypothetical protein
MIGPAAIADCFRPSPCQRSLPSASSSAANTTSVIIRISWFMAFARVLAPLGGDYLLPMRAGSPEQAWGRL